MRWRTSRMKLPRRFMWALRRVTHRQKSVSSIVTFQPESKFYVPSFSHFTGGDSHRTDNDTECDGTKSMPLTLAESPIRQTSVDLARGALELDAAVAVNPCALVVRGLRLTYVGRSNAVIRRDRARRSGRSARTIAGSQSAPGAGDGDNDPSTPPRPAPGSSAHDRPRSGCT